MTLLFDRLCHSSTSTNDKTDNTLKLRRITKLYKFKDQSLLQKLGSKGTTFRVAWIVNKIPSFGRCIC